MTKTELLELIRNGESSGVEFKRDLERQRDLAKELVAFCNLQGGLVLLGVEDSGEISGLTRVDDEDADERSYRQLEEWVMQVCRDKIRPEIIPYFEIIRDVTEGQDVAVVRVGPGWSVHCVWHQQHRTYYIRVGTLSREAGPEELERLFQQRGSVRAELQPVSGSSIADIDLSRVSYYFRKIRDQEVPDDGRIGDWEELLVNTELMVGEPGQRSVTVAGLLLFGRNPRKFLRHASIDAAAYAGADKDYTAQERATFSGPILPAFDDNGELTNNGLIEQALDFVRVNTGSRSVLEDGGRRIDTPVYPPEAVRETIVNAVVHRDYLLSATDIELSVYADRIEVISPGRLPNGITPKRMRTGTRAARNQLLKDIMRDYGYLEHMGMGVPRKIVRLMRDEVGTEPEFVEDEERLVVTLYAEP